ncbi:MAG: hypothetical protein ACI4PO_06395 [Faecousia sp.]
MTGTYDILLGGKPVGQASVTEQGLYYRFDCRCRITGEVMYKLTVTCGGKTEDLGLLVPEGKDFVLKCRLPEKRLGQGKPEFRAIPRHGRMEGTFIPVYPDEPFSYISRLHSAFLENRGGQMGVVLPGKTEDFSS